LEAFGPTLWSGHIKRFRVGLIYKCIDIGPGPIKTASRIAVEDISDEVIKKVEKEVIGYEG
jgi:hypothetical protein